MHTNEYEPLFSLYKKLPIILTILLMAFFIIGGLADVALFSDWCGNNAQGVCTYGIMQAKSPLIVIAIWLTLGVISSLCTYFLSAILITPTILQTQALMTWSKSAQPRTESQDKQAC